MIILLDRSLLYLPGYSFFEDVPKFLGILSWFLYFTQVCSVRIRSRLSAPGDG
jgi:hypothetical protein